jgi:Sec-independent protein translocase protein TatA
MTQEEKLLNEQNALRELLREVHGATRDLRSAIKEAKQLAQSLNDEFTESALNLLNAHEKRVVEVSDVVHKDLEKSYRRYFDGLASAIKEDNMRVTHIGLMRSEKEHSSFSQVVNNISVLPPEIEIELEDET